MSFAIPYPEGRINLATDRVSAEDAQRQERTAREILRRLENQPGLILADEVGMGKTFVALAVASAIALERPNDGPVIVMVPPSLKQKWPKDWSVFFEKCLDHKQSGHLDAALADSGVALLRLLDDAAHKRKEIIFLTHGALHRSLTDEWVKFALIRRALRKRSSMAHVRRALRRFAGRLLRRHWLDHKNPDLWERLLDNPPERWGKILRAADISSDDDPVPRTLIEAMDLLEFDDILEALERLPLRESPNLDERLQETRRALTKALSDVWQTWLGHTRFHSPLLIFDEAHHLKNMTQISSLFVEEGAKEDSETVSRGPLAGVFSRMLFLTATPFQLGHHELINVLSRFEGVNWNSPDAPQDGKVVFKARIAELETALSEAQKSSLHLERSWGRLSAGDLRGADGRQLTPDDWWQGISQRKEPGTEVCERFTLCQERMRAAETLLKPWVIRHLKGRFLPARPGKVPQNRREVLVGAGIKQGAPVNGDAGLEVSGESLLPFLLAVRAQIALASRPSDGVSKRAVFAEGLASSYEAYLETRRGKADVDDDDAAPVQPMADDWQVNWYLQNLDKVLPAQDEEIRSRHPKLAETVDRAIKLWWDGEKSLIFCHYRATGKALRRYVSRKLEQQILERATAVLQLKDAETARVELDKLADQFFDTDGRLRSVAQNSLRDVVAEYPDLPKENEEQIVEIGLRFLRTPSFLIRYFALDTKDPVSALTEAFEKGDNSGLTVKGRIREFCRFLAERCVEDERKEFLDALGKIQTGTYRRDTKDGDDDTDDVRYLPNVRLANGEVSNVARRRLMLAFNTPFFPEILIASSVLAEGVDLHLDCRFVIHHDLCWNPSTIEQRTGRVDRIGCKAEQAYQPIHVYLPFVTATQDEKMFRVVRDRERWFSVIMGEKYTVDEASTEKLVERVPFPEDAARRLAFDLSLQAGSFHENQAPLTTR
jgi:superfamily II DNA or RNA helicase